MSAAIAIALDTLAADMTLSTADRHDVTLVVGSVEAVIAEWGFSLNAERRLALTAHSLAFTRRIRTREELPEIDLDDFPEIPEKTVLGLRDALIPYCTARENHLADEEVLLFAMHVEVARLTH